MKSVLLAVCGLALTTCLVAQSNRTWTSNSNQDWSRTANWSGGRPDADNEVAQFGTGGQHQVELDSNSYTVRGIRFSAGAGAYDVGDDNGSRTLKIGSSSTGFLENLSATNQLISIATLQFQSDATIRTTGTGDLTLSSRLSGTNRDLIFNTSANGDITVSGNITTGTGTLTKQGSGDLFLSGANTYTGTTTISGGAIVLQASEVFANSGRIDVASGASLDLNNFSERIARLTGAGTVDFGSGGTLTLGSGSSSFSGAFTGTGTLVIGAGATFTLGANFNNTGINLILDGGSLLLAGHSLSAGALSITDDSAIDFGWGWLDSSLSVTSLGFGAVNVDLDVKNWTNAADYFYSQTGYTQGSAPLDQVEFQGWDTDDTKWQSYDHQITPVPEPSTYGAGLIALALAVAAWRRRFRS